MSDDCTGELTDFDVKAADATSGSSPAWRHDAAAGSLTAIVIDPLGATFTNPVQLLLCSRQTACPSAMSRSVRRRRRAFRSRPRCRTIPEPGPLRDRVELAPGRAIKARSAVKSVSPGYRALARRHPPNATGGVRFPQDGISRAVARHGAEANARRHDHAIYKRSTFPSLLSQTFPRNGHDHHSRTDHALDE